MTPTAVAAALILALGTPLLLPACADDDGAQTRESGGVSVIGPPPPGGGGSVSAIGPGCTTRGATTKKVAFHVQFGLDEHSIEPPPAITAGVNRIVAKNFGTEPHELVITRTASVDELPVAGGALDLEALPDEVYRIAEFAGNTICEGTFELPAGDYVALSNVDGPDGNDFEQGMATSFTVTP